MSIAQTEEKRSGELAHRSASPNGCIGRQPASEENRRFFELVLRSIFLQSKNPGGLTFGAFACVKGEFFGIAIADLTSVIKSVINIPCFPLGVYNYITEE